MITLEINTSPTPKHFWRWLSFSQVGYVSLLGGTSFLSWTHFHNPKLHAAKGEHFKRYAAYPSIHQSSSNISEKKIHTVSFLLTPWRKHVSWDFMHWKWFLFSNGFVLVFKQRIFKKTMHLPGFSGGAWLVVNQFSGGKDMLRVVAKSWWLDNPTAKTTLTFRKVIVLGVFLEEFWFVPSKWKCCKLNLKWFAYHKLCGYAHFLSNDTFTSFTVNGSVKSLAFLRQSWKW